MSIGAINNDHGTWGTTALSRQAAGFGGQGGGADFEETLKNSVGFGTRNGSGGLTGSIAAASSGAGDLISQLQFSLLKNDGLNGLSSRLNNALL